MRHLPLRSPALDTLLGIDRFGKELQGQLITEFASFIGVYGVHVWDLICKAFATVHICMNTYMCDEARSGGVLR